MQRKKFLISIDNFDPTSGGIVAMHKLCNDIIDLGREAYVTARASHNKLKTPFIGSREMKTNEWVVVYPEIVHGNPYSFKHVVRWVLNTPGVCGGVGSGFYDRKLPTDLVFKYSPFFKYDGIIDGHLRCTFIDYDTFNNKNVDRDIESMFFTKKGGMSKKYHPDGSLDFARYQFNWELAAQMLNRCKYFYCYDNECFWVTLAALCGCIPIVIPNTTLSFDDWSTFFPFNKYGISFGIENIKYAVDTINMVENHCRQIQQVDLEGVGNFINLCDNL